MTRSWTLFSQFSLIKLVENKWSRNNIFDGRMHYYVNSMVKFVDMYPV